jgi:hypothetical protein
VVNLQGGRRAFRVDPEEVKYQSGETGHVSKVGDGGVRAALCEVAHVILTKGSTMRSWGMRLGSRRYAQSEGRARSQACRRAASHAGPTAPENCSEPSEMPTVLAIARPVEWIAWCGGSVQVSATTCAVVSAAFGALPGLRVFSRSAEASTMRARSTCLRGRLRSAAVAANRSRSAGEVRR